MSKNSPKHAGFSLIEILIVIAIIALLTIIAITGRRFQIQKAKDGKIKDDIARIHIALENYYSDNDCYPEAGILQNCGGNELEPYLASIPCTSAGNPYCYIPEDASCPQHFRILASLENPNDPNIEELGCEGDQACGYENTCAEQIPGTSGYNYGVSSTNVSLASPDMEDQASPSPTSSPDLTGQFACAPNGICNAYEDPEGSGCPITFNDPSTCQDYCDQSSEYWCNN